MLAELTDGRKNLDPDRREALLSTLVLGAVRLYEGGQFSYIAKGVLPFLRRSRMRANDLMLLSWFIADEGDAKEMGEGGDCQA